MVSNFFKGIASWLLSFLAGASWQFQRHKADALQKRIDSIDDAKNIHDRIDSDDDYAQRVRDEYR